MCVLVWEDEEEGLRKTIEAIACRPTRMEATSSHHRVGDVSGVRASPTVQVTDPLDYDS